MAKMTPSGHAKAEPVLLPANVVQLRPDLSRFPVE